MNKLTREEALRRWKSAKATKKAMVDKMQLDRINANSPFLKRKLIRLYKRKLCRLFDDI